MNPTLSQMENFNRFIKGSNILIGDRSPSTGNSLVRVFQAMGAAKEQVFWAPDFDTARREIDRRKPKLLICDYHLGSQSGLNLVEAQRRHFPKSKDSLFLLLTDNTSQTAVARAAEEEV